MAAPIQIPTPYTVVIDSREQRPFTFGQALADTHRNRVQIVQTTVAALPSGDYSIAGFEDRIAVERKSLADLYSTLGQGRVRFIKELERLAAYEYSAVVVEAEWSQVLLAPPERSQLLPKTIIFSVIAWQQRFSRTHWWFLPTRDAAEAATIRILDRFWRDRNA